uniref:AH domain-containing protein n=1 Tax=Loa loa TaxID=7209 RepID=A0A1I7W2L5_LOALO
MDVLKKSSLLLECYHVMQQCFIGLKLWLSTQILLEKAFGTKRCMENFVQYRTMKKARDVCDQLEGLLEKVEIGQ